MGKERELLTKLRMLEQDAHKKYYELDIIFQQIVETKAKIEEQRQKQVKMVEWKEPFKESEFTKGREQ